MRFGREEEKNGMNVTHAHDDTEFIIWVNDTRNEIIGSDSTSILIELLRWLHQAIFLVGNQTIQNPLVDEATVLKVSDFFVDAHCKSH